MKYQSCLLMSAMAMATLGAQAKEISVISFGGANKDAQVKAYYQPFTKDTGINVVAGEYNGEMAKLKAMVETKSVSWDVVEVESSEVARGCDEGFFEKLDYKVIGKKSEFIPGAASKAASRVYLAVLRMPRLPGNLLTSQKSAQEVGAVASFLLS